MIHIAWPWLLLLAPLPWLAARWLPPASNAQFALRVPFFREVSAVSDGAQSLVRSSTGQRWPAILIWFLLLVAAARPQWLGEPIALPLTGRDIMLAIDLSGSMETPDFVRGNQQLSRLDVVKETAQEFVQQRTGDRIGLILFGTRAYLQAPLTFDRETIGAMIDDATIGLAGKDTAIGDAIGLATKRLHEENVPHRILILLTDGANTAGAIAPLKAAEIAAQDEMRIYTIGIGADEESFGSSDVFGGIHLMKSASDLDEGTLRAIADKTGGKYFRAKDATGLQEIYQQLNELEPHESDQATLRPTRELFFWPLTIAAAGIFLLLIMQLPWHWWLASQHRRSNLASAKPPERTP